MPSENRLQFEEQIDPKSIVLIINPLQSYWSFQLTAEIAYRAKSHSDSVYWLDVGFGRRKNFLINKSDYISRVHFKNPLGELKKTLTLAGITVIDDFDELSQEEAIPAFTSISELREYKFQGLNLGAVIYSGVAGMLHTTSFSLKTAKRYIEHEMKLGFQIYEVLQKTITGIKPNLILTINDRLVGSAMAINLANKYKINSSIVYWGSEPNSIEDYSHSLYSMEDWQEKIMKKWTLSPPKQEELFELRNELSRLKHEPSEDSKQFLSLQSPRRGLEKAKKKLCVFYAQSEHEHSASFISNIPGKFKSQYEAFQALQEIALSHNFQLALKFHPLKANRSKIYHDQLLNLDWSAISIDSRVIQISPDSDIDTYELMSQADVNVVWSSTVGLESIARELPTLVLGRPLWANKDWAVVAGDKEQIRAAFLTENFKIPCDSLLPWFWYLRDYGSKSRYAKINDGAILTISGRNIFRPRIFYKINNLVKKFVR